MNKLQAIFNNILKCKNPDETIEAGTHSELKKNFRSF